MTETQGERLRVIADHRNDVTHELLKYVVDPDFDPDLKLLAEALEILTHLHRFWAHMEIDMGTFEHLGVEVSPEDVQPAWGSVLWLCIDSLAGSDALRQEGDGVVPSLGAASE